MASARLVPVPDGAVYEVRTGRAGTLKDSPRDGALWDDNHLATFVVRFRITELLTNLIFQRGRWTVEARPVSGIGLDGRSTYRRTVRNQRVAATLAEAWVSRLESGEPPVSG